MINIPIGSGQKPDLQIDRLVYDEFLLLQSLRAVEGREHLTLPRDFRELVEYVYHEDEPSSSVNNELHQAWIELGKKTSKARAEANLRLLPAPDPKTSFAVYAASRLHFVEDEDNAAWFIAQTRLGEETVTVIPLEMKAGLLWCTGVGEPLDPNQPASKEQQYAMLRQSLKVGGRLVTAIKQVARPPLFEKSTLLKNTYPLVLDNGCTTMNSPFGNIKLKLDPVLGLVISNKKG